MKSMKGVNRFYIITMSQYAGPPVCVRVFKSTEHIKALEEMKRLDVDKFVKEYDTISVDIPDYIYLNSKCEKKTDGKYN